MTRTPSAVWIVDTNKEHLAVEEARKLRIPIIGILDSNCDPDVVDYPIPGNDDAIRAVGLLTRVVADAVADGLIARSGAKTGDGDAAGIGAEEPLAEWERELLQGDAEQAAPSEAPAAADAPATDPTSADGPTSAATEAGAPEGPIVVPEGSPADAPAAEVTGATTEAADTPAGSATDTPAEGAAADSAATDDGNA
jgi:small subunit ribosomal protein S2